MKLSRRRDVTRAGPSRGRNIARDRLRYYQATVRCRHRFVGSANTSDDVSMIFKKRIPLRQFHLSPCYGTGWPEQAGIEVGLHFFCVSVCVCMELVIGLCNVTIFELRFLNLSLLVVSHSVRCSATCLPDCPPVSSSVTSPNGKRNPFVCSNRFTLRGR